MRRDRREEQAALLEGLVDEAEVEHLEVAQAAVDELARARAGAAGVVARLDEAGRETPRHGVERDAAADDAPADDEDVELLAGAEPLEGGRACRGGEGHGNEHRWRAPPTLCACPPHVR